MRWQAGLRRNLVTTERTISKDTPIFRFPINCKLGSPFDLKTVVQVGKKVSPDPRTSSEKLTDLESVARRVGAPQAISTHFLRLATGAIVPTPKRGSSLHCFRPHRPRSSWLDCQRLLPRFIPPATRRQNGSLR